MKKNSLEKQPERSNIAARMLLVFHSMAITIEETLRQGKSTGKLYDEMILCNSIENIVAADLEAEGNIEAEA